MLASDKFEEWDVHLFLNENLDCQCDGSVDDAKDL